MDIHPYITEPPEDNNAAGAGCMARLVRFWWWVGFSIIWIAWSLLIATPICIAIVLHLVMEQVIDWVPTRRLEKLKRWVESLAPPSKTNS
jgi:hypothetical protein